jgi:hypothetical protein
MAVRVQREFCSEGAPKAGSTAQQMRRARSEACLSEASAPSSRGAASNARR